MQCSYPQALSDMLQGAKSRLKQVELRTLVAHVFRCIIDGLRPGAMRSESLLRNCVLEFIADTVKYLASASSGKHCHPLLICLYLLSPHLSRGLYLQGHSLALHTPPLSYAASCGLCVVL